MTKREFYVLIEKGEDGYLIADVPELPGCHTSDRDYAAVAFPIATGFRGL